MLNLQRIIAELGDLPNEPVDAYLTIAEAALSATEKINKSSTAKKSLNIKMLIDFLRETSKELEVTQPSINIPSSDSGRIEYIHEYISRIRSIQLAKSLSDRIGPRNFIGSSAIEISNAGMVKIHTLLGELRRTVENSDLTQKKKKLLQDRLTDFERELVAREISMTNAFTVLALIGATVAGTTSTLADGPSALETIGKITAYLGIEKEAQDSAAAIAQDQQDVPSLVAPREGEGEAQ